jgi:hypothetical protein
MSAIKCDAGGSLCGNVLSGVIQESSADERYLAKSVAVRSLVSVILDEYETMLKSRVVFSVRRPCCTAGYIGIIEY